jgi:eukaryotic-like serine/threonine-protein kinase
MVAAGDVWEGHELLSELDRGMVRTFLARQIGDTSSLVWLHLREGARTGGGTFKADMRSLQQLAEQVPNIDPVLYGDASDSVAWIASPFHTGAIRLKEAAAGAELGATAITTAIELGEYLARCHRLGLVHGFMSPERVLITPERGYVITHFGFPKLFRIGEEDAAREPRYAAPELLFGRRIDKRTDVYGLGTVLYQLVFRRELYAGEDQLALCAQAQPLIFPTATPLDVRVALGRALMKAPRDRYPSVKEMLSVLHQLAGSWEELHRAPGPAERLPETMRTAHAIVEEAPRSPSSPATEPPPAADSPSANDGEVSAPACDLGTLDPPFPRDGAEEPVEPHPRISPAPASPPEAPPSLDRRGRAARHRAHLAVLGVALGALALGDLAGALLRQERPAKLVAQLARLASIDAVPSRPATADVRKGSGLGSSHAPQKPARDARPIARQPAAMRHAVLVQTPPPALPSTLLQQRCDGVYSCQPRFY